MRDTMADDKTVVFKLSIVRQIYLYISIYCIFYEYVEFVLRWKRTESFERRMKLSVTAFSNAKEMY